MKVQPIDANGPVAFAPRGDPVRPAAKSRLKRLFEWQFPSVLRPTLAEKFASAGDGKEKERENGGDDDPSSVCLDTMVLRFIEDGNHEKPPRGRCICFNANFDDISDDDFDARDADALSDAAEAIKVWVPCASVAERNLLADASKILEKANNSNKHTCRMMVAEWLRSLGHDAAICTSRWDKNPFFPAGEYEYIDVVVDDGHRFLVDVDFKSEFEVARPTKSYRAILQHLPPVFVGRPDRLQRIIALTAEAARQSMKKKGLHIPPWRRPEYLKAKWFSPYQRTTAVEEGARAKEALISGGTKSSCGSGIIPRSISGVNFSGDVKGSSAEEAEDDGTSSSAGAADDNVNMAASPWQRPPARPKVGAKETKYTISRNEDEKSSKLTLLECSVLVLQKPWQGKSLHGLSRSLSSSNSMNDAVLNSKHCEAEEESRIMR